MRLFVAIEFPEAVRTELGCVQGELKEALGTDYAWSSPKNLHLTLKFLGEVDVDELARLQDALASALARHAPLRLDVEGLGAFPNANVLRVIWAGVRGEVDELIALQRDVDDETEALGYPKEQRAYHPHVTLARKRERGHRHGRSGNACVELIESRRQRGFGGYEADRVVLMESKPGPGGSEYAVIASWSLPMARRLSSPACADSDSRPAGRTSP